MQIIKTLSVTYDIPIERHQLPKFRGAVVELLGREHDLFHNHKEDNYHYRYPKIQYKLNKGGKVGIIGLNEGADALDYLITSGHRTICFDGKKQDFHLSFLKKTTVDLQMTKQDKEYRIYNWLALNTENFDKWKNSSSFAKKATELERLLAANIISFAKGVGWNIEKRFEVEITNIKNTKTMKFKQNPLMAFDVDFKTNLVLPINVGFGKAAGFGFGTVHPIYKKNSKITFENNSYSKKVK